MKDAYTVFQTKQVLQDTAIQEGNANSTDGMNEDSSLPFHHEVPSSPQATDVPTCQIRRINWGGNPDVAQARLSGAYWLPIDSAVTKQRRLSNDLETTVKKRARVQQTSSTQLATWHADSISTPLSQLCLIPPPPGPAPRFRSRADYALVLRPKITGPDTIIPLEDIFKFAQIDNHYQRTEL
ncbi:hypothetical protein CC86DRAFT_472491 [Ophiobolus disseminans]|uniref:Uncharacterized protein n=1 Tax=Ophiobolus disseminans TaxID=1469910 RepID=A0A6A6ZCI9_9PLEO|nr:hypothetical protein CC86DRAFT_472491 [Ophiobolus disseminans]